MSINHNIYQNFRQPLVRDLAFSIACPNVLNQWIGQPTNLDDKNTTNIQIHSSQFWQQQYLAYQSRLTALENNANTYQSLNNFLANRPSPHRLGFHFEGLLLFWLLDGFTHNCHPFQLIEHNIQIIKNNITLGELDIILYNHDTQQIEHWELAIKFFLGSPPYQPKNWVGINSKDNLQRKANHMMNKPFSHHTITNSNNHQHIINHRYAIIKGRFFCPNHHKTTFKLPEWMNPSFPMHYWYDESSIHTLLTYSLSLRHASYIEWFTKRLDETYPTTLPLSQTMTSGLYFIKPLKTPLDEQPIVLLTN